MAIDRFGRKIHYLRISLTDHCNLRCVYCMPEEGLPWLKRDKLLTYEEILRLVSVAVRGGVRKVRITGGEPLLRRDLPELIGMLAREPGLEDLALTTNGLLLAREAAGLVDRELSAVGRVIARAVRLRIRLAAGVRLIDVVGSRRLDEVLAERVGNVLVHGERVEQGSPLEDHAELGTHPREFPFGK